MSHTLNWTAGVVSMTFDYDSDSPVALTRLRVADAEALFEHRVPIVEIMTVGTGHRLACNKLTHTVVGADLRYEGHQQTVDGECHELSVKLRDDIHHIAATVSYRVDGRAAMVNTEVTVENLDSEAPLLLDSVTSWCGAFGSCAGMKPDLRAWDLLEGAFDWLAEGRWSTRPVTDVLPKIGQELTGVDPRQEHAVVSTGTWSTGVAAPLAVLESKRFGLAWLFQIEHNGAWRWDIEDDTEDGCIALAGPTNENHSWAKTLACGETFTTVPASFTLADCFDGVIRNVTEYRRAMRSPHSDNSEPRVVFNDYMNTINGDPTTAKELPLIKAAGGVGVEIFVIDCGWYDDTGDWWPSVGEWLPSTTRFPNGITEVIDAIRNAGMVPGIWIEPEVVGVRSPMANKLPDSAFFQRRGQRVVEQDRYILDLRDASARAHLDAVVDRLVNEYGIGYFKFDYNVSPGSGTDADADSAGDGLLGHNRAYSEWIDGLRARYPEVILENCSSGGMREDFAQLSRFQVQSTSDQQDYRLYPAIAAAAPMMVLPEQSANWAYPQSDMDAETTAFNINTTFLGRFFLSGYLNRMDEGQHAMVAAGIESYKRYVQPVIGSAVPFWPMGLPDWTDTVVSLGLDTGDGALVTIWNRDGEGGRMRLDLSRFKGRPVTVENIFPTGDLAPWPCAWNEVDGELTVDVPQGGYTSRTLRITCSER